MKKFLLSILKITGIVVAPFIIIAAMELAAFFNVHAEIKEERIDIFNNNKKDFDYVAATLKRFNGKVSINFDYSGDGVDFNDCIISDIKNIEDILLSDKDFYESLNNIYNLNEIHYINKNVNGTVEIYFIKPLRYFDFNIIYTEGKRCLCMQMIDNEWAVQMAIHMWPLYHYHNYD